MNTLADLKRRIVTGTNIKLIDTNMVNHRFLGITRTVTKVQSNGFYMATPEQIAKGEKGSYLDFPKAGEVTLDKDRFRIEPNDQYDFLTYEFVEGA